MKKFILIICTLLFSVSAIAAETSTNTYNNNSTIKKEIKNLQDPDTEGADDFYRELIAPQYGSDQSPAFLNRENINPSESSYNYGSSDAAECDSSDDSGNYPEQE